MTHTMEQHPFIALPDYPVSYILLGSFPCLKNGQYGEWFYLGSGRSNFWRLIEAVYQTTVPTRADKEALMRGRNIWITDIAKSIVRKKENHGCLDANLKIEAYNHEMLEKVLNGNAIKKVLCTSAWVAEVWEKKLLPLMHLEGAAPVAVKLPSPSPMADQAIRANAEYKAMVAADATINPWEYRLKKFKEALPE